MSITGPAGFRANGVASGVKADGELDLAVVAAGGRVTAAAVFTTNTAAAAPVSLSKVHLASSDGIVAVVANSGCANAATGAQGEASAASMAQAVADQLGCSTHEVLVASTGPIGPQLPVDRVVAGVGNAVAGLSVDGEAAARAAAAILTTDTVTKEVLIEGSGYSVGGMAKGSGMIRPDMATMLVFLTSDAEVERELLAGALRAAVDDSFHALNIDGCQSTNDMVVVLASGAAGVRAGASELEELLTTACIRLSEMMASDAEGAARVVAINVTGASSDEEARRAGRAMADSVLVRASFYGGDPNWGRLIGAAGASDVPFDPGEFSAAYQGITVASGGVVVDFDEETLLALMERGDLSVDIGLGTGDGSARVLTTDLTPDYVVFNGERS